MRADFTPERIEELSSGEIFVFGSNLNGNHYGGAARIAYEKFGAEWGVSEGLSGSTYAIPTLDKEMQPVSKTDLFNSFCSFIAFIKKHPDLTFYLTKIGCGIAGWSVCEVAEIFFDALEHVAEMGKLPSNLILPKEFHLYPEIQLCEKEIRILRRMARKSSDENERERLHNEIVDKESQLNVLRDEMGMNNKP